MSENAITLKNFFEAKGDELSSEAQQNNFEAENQVVTLREKVAKEHKQLGWSSVSKLLIEKIGSLLDADLKDILIGAWKKSDEVLKCLDESAASSKPSTVALAEHIGGVDFTNFDFGFRQHGWEKDIPCKDNI